MNYFPYNTSHMEPPSKSFSTYKLNFAPQVNKFVYVKQQLIDNNISQFACHDKPSKVIVNPHFMKKIYVNPKFNSTGTSASVHINPNFNKTIHLNPNRKKTVHVNPNILKNVVPANHLNLGFTVKKLNYSNENVKEPVENNTLTKSVHASVEVNHNTISKKRRKSIRTKYKIVKSSDNLNRSSTDTIKKRNSIHTRYQILRSPYTSKKPVGNKFRIDNRKKDKKISVNPRLVKKKFIYVNKFLSMSDIAKNMLVKQNKQLKRPGFVDINGILYTGSPNTLKRTSISNKDAILISKTIFKSKYKLIHPTSKLLVKNKSNHAKRKNVISKETILRSKKLKVKNPSPNKLKKNNIPCPFYRKFGRCRGLEKKTCVRKHDPDQVILCTKFLQGACLNDKCLLSHKVSPEKMPTCKYYLEGSCSKDQCPYLHVKISPKADICRDFVEGFCRKGKECNLRHQLLCPDFEKDGKCLKTKCPYPHGTVVRKYSIFSKFAKKCSTKNQKQNKRLKRSLKSSENDEISRSLETETSNLCKSTNKIEKVNMRYYVDNVLSNNQEVNTSEVVTNENMCEDNVVCDNAIGMKFRPQLGELPAFIPLMKDS